MAHINGWFNHLRPFWTAFLGPLVIPLLVVLQFSSSGGGGGGGVGAGGIARNTAASASAASVPHAVASGAVRRSNVVKEVERLKENREKRRQRQAELKEEKVTNFSTTFFIFPFFELMQ